MWEHLLQKLQNNQFPICRAANSYRSLAAFTKPVVLRKRNKITCQNGKFDSHISEVAVSSIHDPSSREMHARANSVAFNDENTFEHVAREHDRPFKARKRARHLRENAMHTMGSRGDINRENHRSRI